MKIGLLHTNTSIVEKTAFEKAITEQMGANIEFCHVENAQLLTWINEAGGITKEVFLGLLDLYEELVKQGVDVVLSTCTAATPAAITLGKLAEHTKVPVISVDEGICEQALVCGSRLAIVGTSAVAIKILTERALSLQGDAKIVPVKLAFPKEASRDEKASLIVAALKQLAEPIDVVLLAQPTLNFAVETVAKATGYKTLGAIGATAVKVKQILG